MRDFNFGPPITKVKDIIYRDNIGCIKLNLRPCYFKHKTDNIWVFMDELVNITFAGPRRIVSRDKHVKKSFCTLDFLPHYHVLCFVEFKLKEISL